MHLLPLIRKCRRRCDCETLQTHTPMRLRALALVTALSLVASCGDDGITAPQLPVTFSGTIDIQNGTTVPANARVLVLWGVSAGSPDYSYVFGSGTLGANGTFTITFTENPPAAALNQ